MADLVDEDSSHLLRGKTGLADQMRLHGCHDVHLVLVIVEPFLVGTIGISIIGVDQKRHSGARNRRGNIAHQTRVGPIHGAAIHPECINNGFVQCCTTGTLVEVDVRVFLHLFANLFHSCLDLGRCRTAIERLVQNSSSFLQESFALRFVILHGVNAPGTFA